MSITQGTWERRAWTSHAFTTVGVADDSVPTGFRIVAECETVDDARLIAAAKSLLEAATKALQEMRNTVSPRDSFTDALDALYDAVTEATGAQT